MRGPYIGDVEAELHQVIEQYAGNVSLLFRRLELQMILQVIKHLYVRIELLLEKWSCRLKKPFGIFYIENWHSYISRTIQNFKKRQCDVNGKLFLDFYYPEIRIRPSLI